MTLRHPDITKLVTDTQVSQSLEEEVYVSLDRNKLQATASIIRLFCACAPFSLRKSYEDTLRDK